MPLTDIIPLASEADTSATGAIVPHEQLLSLIEQFGNKSAEETFSFIIGSTVEFVAKILFAALIYFAGQWLIKRLVYFLQKIFELRNLEVSLSRFIISLVKITLTIILVLTTVGLIGINTTSFLAIFASAGLAVGMALSGTLQNFAGGVLILFLKPYKIGDFIEAQGYTGTVKEISLFSTLVNTVDNKMVIIPNGSLSTGIINNFSKESTRRVDWVVGVAYGTDYDTVRKLILQIINSDERVIKDKEVTVVLDALADSSVNIVVRAWTNSGNYWPLYFDFNEQVYKRFNEAGIEFPFPQMDVHLKREEVNS